jgi:hypothetical protein
MRAVARAGASRAPAIAGVSEETEASGAGGRGGVVVAMGARGTEPDDGYATLVEHHALDGAVCFVVRAPVTCAIASHSSSRSIG